MDTILIPTDFSRLSRVGGFYAAGLAGEYGARLVLLHVVHLEGPPRAMLKAGAIEDAMQKASEQDGERFAEELRKAGKGIGPVEVRVIRGYPVHEIVEDTARKEQASLVVIGTHGASGIRRVLLGSTAMSVINNSSVPVISVPEHAVHSDIKRILYATNLVGLEEEVSRLAELARLLRATVDAVHVALPGEALSPEQQAVLERLQQGTLHPEIRFHAVRGESVGQAVDDFAVANHSDLIAMFTHHAGFFETLFGRSTAIEMAFHARIPLYTFRKN